MQEPIKGLTTDRDEFLSREELKEYDYDFLNKLYVMFLDDEGALFNWLGCNGLVEQLDFHKKYVDQIKPKNVLEVGTHKGYYSYFMKKLIPDVKIWTFGINEESQLCVDEIHKYFGEEFITFFPGNSVETLSNFENPEQIKFDLAWVDGGHDYECAYSDLKNCARLGIDNILIDDCDNGLVSKSVQNFVNDNQPKYVIMEESPFERKITYIGNSSHWKPISSETLN
jgi:hypothetical protein